MHVVNNSISNLALIPKETGIENTKFIYNLNTYTEDFCRRLEIKDLQKVKLKFLREKERMKA